MKSPDLPAIRLASQRISASHCEQPGDLVAHMGAMQAQDHGQALWAIGLRTAGAGVADVRAAIAAHEVVRTWMLRGTLHFVAGRDLRWMLALLGERSIASMTSRHRQLELDDKVFAQCRQLLEKALQGGQQLARPAAFALLNEAGIATTGQRGIHILWRLSQEGVLCFGEHEGKQATFALLDEWLAPAAAMPRGQALAELCKRYFISHGPATLADFATWAGITLGDAKLGLAAAREALEELRLGEASYWMAPGAADTGQGGRGAYLLPGFDEYLLGYKDRSAVLDPAYAGRIAPGGNGVFKPMIVVDGKVRGTWQRTGATIAFDPFLPLKKAETKALDDAARSFQEF